MNDSVTVTYVRWSMTMEDRYIWMGPIWMLR